MPLDYSHAQGMWGQPLMGPIQGNAGYGLSPQTTSAFNNALGQPQAPQAPGNSLYGGQGQTGVSPLSTPYNWTQAGLDWANSNGFGWLAGQQPTQQPGGRGPSPQYGWQNPNGGDVISAMNGPIGNHLAALNQFNIHGDGGGHRGRGGGTAPINFGLNGGGVNAWGQGLWG